jgi:DNA polymerase
MLVGEAPGREEDLSGRPFVGRGGKLLSAALEAAGSSRKEVFITNVVKCRPPRNRQPRARERGTCAKAHLSREIGAVAPRVVVLLGRTAAVTLLGVESLKEARGKPSSRDGTVYFGTYHPAAVLRNPRLKRALVRDLRAALLLGNQGQAS